LLRDEPFDCREMEGSPLRVHTKFKPDSSTPTRFMIFKPEDPNDFHLMDRLTDVFVEPSRLLSFRCMLPQLVHFARADFEDNFFRIMICFILTNCYRFSGLFHA
jgi:hypothetical protein